MKKEKIWMLFDGRYRADEDAAICYEVCNSLKEARRNADDYGTDTVIVEGEIVDNIVRNSIIIN